MIKSSGIALERKLRNAGLRITSQRLHVLKVLTETDGHLSAEDIHAKVRERAGKVSLATIYRTIGALKEARLVEPRFFAGEHEKERFELTQEAEHHHFKCHVCGNVFEFEADLLEQLRASLLAERGWRLASACMCFEGICENCAIQASDTVMDEFGA